jgi:alpha/beta superfamily hydrolase
VSTVSFRPPTPERLEIAGPSGPLEALVETPAEFDGARMAVVCHPHPLFGGTMTNKVVHVAARALQEKGYATVRFNFRGVGTSAGAFDDGRGEADDATAVADWAAQRWPGATLTLAGFSFGSFVAFQVAGRRAALQLLMIAPPVRRFDFTQHAAPTVPWVVFQGDQDELVDWRDVKSWTETVTPAPTVVILPGAEHFFHGRLNDLRAEIQARLP